MIVRRLSEATTVEWGNGVSRRLLLAADGMGFALTDSIALPGSVSRMHYPNHLEAVYCIDGSGELLDSQGNRFRIEPDVMYALDRNDEHTLIADAETGLRGICVFNPPLTGPERHDLSANGYSHYYR